MFQKNIHIKLLLVLITDTDTDTNTKKFQDGYGYGYKNILGRIQIRIQKNFRTDTDTQKFQDGYGYSFVIFTDTVSVDGYLYPSDPADFKEIDFHEY